MQATPGFHRSPRGLAAVLAATALAAPAAAAGQAGAAPAPSPPSPWLAGQAAEAPVPGPARGRGLVRTFDEPDVPRADPPFDWTAAGLGAGTAGPLGLLAYSGLHSRGRAARRLAG
jgi:hypothetical protein